MIVDYKIILILILAIVVLIIYNKIEYVKSDVNKLEEKNSKLEDEIYELQKKISFLEKNNSNESCEIKTLNKVSKKKEEMSILDKINSIHEKEFNTQGKDIEVLTDKVDVIEKDTVEKDTIEYNATEELEFSDTETITTNQSENIVTYSNEKNDSKNDEVNELIDQLASKDIIEDKELFLAEVISTNSNESDKVKNKNKFEKDINIDLEYEKNTSDKNCSENSIKDLMVHRLNDLQNIAKSKNINKYLGYYNLNEIMHELSAGIIGPEIRSIWDQNGVKQKVRLLIKSDSREDVFDFERDLMTLNNNWQLCNINRIILN